MGRRGVRATRARTSVRCEALSRPASGCASAGGSGPGSTSPTTSSATTSSGRQPENLKEININILIIFKGVDLFISI